MALVLINENPIAGTAIATVATVTTAMMIFIFFDNGIGFVTLFFKYNCTAPDKFRKLPQIYTIRHSYELDGSGLMRTCLVEC